MTDKWEEAPGYFTDKHAACMTLRDHFAGLAMQGLIQFIGDKYDLSDLSQDAYKAADAMLKAREGRE